MGRNLFASSKESNTEIPKERAGRNLFADKISEESYLEKLPRNIATGFANRGHAALNFPRDVVRSIEQLGHGASQGIDKYFPVSQESLSNNNTMDEFIKQNNVPKELINQNYGKPISNVIPHQQEYDFSKMLGQRGEPTWGDYLTQKGVEFGPELLGGLNAFNRIIPHLTRQGASRRLREARHLSNERTIAPLNINPNLIEDMRQFLPNTLPYRNALDAAHTGNYQALFNLQSDAGKHAADYANSIFSAAERAHGRAGLGARNRLITEMHGDLSRQGHQDISDLLRRGQEDYRRYMAFKPYRNAIMAAGLGSLGLKGLGINPINALKSILNDTLSK